MANNKPSGLLSFLYNARYDDDVRKTFHDDVDKAMELFELSAEVEQVIKTIGEIVTGADEGSRPQEIEKLQQEIEKLMSYLAKEMLEGEMEKIW